MRSASWTISWLIVTVTAASALSGCTSAVTVESRFPAPLVKALPVHMGVIFADALKNYVYVDDLPRDTKWTIDLGDANIAMLTPLFSAMFESVKIVSGVPLKNTAAARIDGILKPVLEKVEFNAPHLDVDKKSQFAEVWLQFGLTLYRPDGTVVAKWPVSGYGKYTLGRDRRLAVNKAAIVALRDIGAAISTQFAKQPKIGRWLQERQNAHVVAANNHQS